MEAQSAVGDVQLDDGTRLTLRHAEHVVRTMVAAPPSAAPLPADAEPLPPYIRKCLQLVLAEYDRRSEPPR